MNRINYKMLRKLVREKYRQGKLSQCEVALAVGVSSSTASRVLNDLDDKWNIEIITKFCAWLNIDASMLMNKPQTVKVKLDENGSALSGIRKIILQDHKLSNTAQAALVEIMEAGYRAYAK